MGIFFKYNVSVVLIVVIFSAKGYSQRFQLKECFPEDKIAIKIVDSITKLKSKDGFAFSHIRLGLGDFSSSVFYLQKDSLRMLKQEYEDRVFMRSFVDTVNTSNPIIVGYAKQKNKLFNLFIDSSDNSRGLNHEHLMCFIAYKNGKRQEFKLYLQTQYLYNLDRGKIPKLIKLFYDDY
jgi:hypothetical protein